MGATAVVPDDLRGVFAAPEPVRPRGKLRPSRCHFWCGATCFVTQPFDGGELAWTIILADLFEAPYEGTQGGALLSITNGKAIVTLNGSQPAPAAEED
jgi:hypothetical protein